MKVKEIGWIIGIAIVSGLIGLLAANFANIVSGSLALLVWLAVWVGLGYLFWKHRNIRFIGGICVLSLGIGCLLIPASFFLVGTQRGGLSALIGPGVALVLAVILAPIGLVLCWVGYKLVSSAPQAEVTIQKPVRSCPSCGSEIADPTALFCEKCGEKLR